MSKFKNTFRIESARLKEWNYSNPWWYYITINTKNHLHHFGEVENSNMVLNELGMVVEAEWLKTKSLRTNVELDYFVIMPNHLHGIIILNPVETRRSVSQKKEILLTSETRRGESLQNDTKAQFGKPISNSLSLIINHFKGSVKRWANSNNYSNFFWQTRFYDRIIRNEKELYNVRKYIEQNPLKWELGKDKSGNIFDL